MLRFLEMLWLGFFLLGLLTLGVLGTWAETAPFWYGAALVAVAGAGALLSRQRTPSEKIAWGPVVLMLLMCVYLGWRGMTSEVRYLARPDLVFAGTALVVYGLVAVRFTGPRARVAVLIVLGLLIAGNTGLGLYQYFEDPRMTVLRGLGLRRAAEISAGGFFESSNHLAGFLTLAGLPLLGVAVLGRGAGLLVRVGSGIGFVIAGIGVAFSTSRGGTAGFFFGTAMLVAIGSIFWLGQRNHRRHKKESPTGWLLIGTGVFFIGLLAVAALNLKKFFGSSDVLASLNGRQPLWDAALEQWQTSPLIGTGARSYEYMERGFRTRETQWMSYKGEIDAVYAHNDYLQTLGDYGLAGLLLILLVTAAHLWSGMSATLRDSRQHSPHPSSGLATGLAAGSAAGIAGMMVQSLADFNLHIGINAVMTGLLLGFLATPGFPAPLKALERSTDPSRPDPSVKHRAGAGINGKRLAFSGILAAVSLVIMDAAWLFAEGDFAYHKGVKQAREASTLPDFLAISGTLERATTLDPDNAKAWALRGLITLEIAARTAEEYSGRFYSAALTQMEQSLKLYPQQPYAAAQAGKVAAWLGHENAADEHFRTALRWGLNIQSVNESYGDHLMVHEKDYYKAVGYLVVALHLSGDAETRSSLHLKIRYCLDRLRKQGITPPPEAFVPAQAP